MGLLAFPPHAPKCILPVFHEAQTARQPCFPERDFKQSRVSRIRFYNQNFKVLP
jgi:hypothetical protein